MLEKCGINDNPLLTFKESRPETNEIASSELTKKIDFLLVIPAHHAPDLVKKAGVAAGQFFEPPDSEVQNLLDGTHMHGSKVLFLALAAPVTDSRWPPSDVSPCAHDRRSDSNSGPMSAKQPFAAGVSNSALVLVGCV